MTEQNNVKQYDWGYELIWVNQETYSSKIVAFNKPGKTDIAFHKNKNKSWFINDGNFRIRWIDTNTGQYYESDIAPGAVFSVPALMPVSIECVGSSGSFTEAADGPADGDEYKVIPAANLGNSNV